MKKLMNLLTKAHVRLLCNEEGASMIEYALLVAGVAVGAALLVGTVNATGDGGSGIMGKVAGFIKNITL